MINLCVLGNSHVASLKLGWEEICSEFPDVHIRFFAAPGSKLNDLDVQGSRLVPTQEQLRQILAFTSEGEPVIDTADYDAFLSYGLSFDIGPIDHRLSAAVYNTYCEERVVRNNNFRLTRKLVSATDRDIYIGHIPLQADTGPLETSPCIPYDTLYGSMSALLAFRGGTLIRQPAVTISQNIRTKAHYTKGSIRLKVSGAGSIAREHGQEDVRHMNSAFGAIYLRDFLKIVQATHQRASTSVG